MKLTHEQAVHCAKAFEDYFGNFDRIDEYMRDQKIDSLVGYSSGGLLGSVEDELFCDFGMHPSEIQHIIDSNTYEGLRAKLEFNNWKKV